MVELVILDMYGTMVYNDITTTPRAGLHEFLQKHKGRVVVSTDAISRNNVMQTLDTMGVTDKIERVYTGLDCVPVEGYEGRRKPLDLICSAYGARPEDTVFISDGEKDKVDAERTGVNFIYVPAFVGPERFSFNQIDLEKLVPYTDLRHKR